MLHGHRHGAVGVRRRPRLGDRNDQRIAEFTLREEAAQFRGDPGLDPDSASRKAALHRVGHGASGHGRRPVADQDDPPDPPAAKGLPNPFRHDIRAEIEDGLPDALPPLDPVFAAEGFPDGEGRLGDLLQKIVGIGAAVDVPRRHLRPHDRVFTDRKGRPVVTEHPNPGRPARGVLIQNGNLPPGSRFLGVGSLLAVHLDEKGRLLHQAVELRGEKVPVGGNPDVNGLAAPLQGEEDPSRFGIAGHGDRMGAFKIVHGQPEGLRHLLPREQVLFNPERDDLRIRRDLRRDRHPLPLQILSQRRVVVDIPVEDHMHAPGTLPIGGIEFLRHPVCGLDGRKCEVADGMAVFLRDRTDRRPACMGQGGLELHREARQRMEDAVAGNLLSQFTNIAAQFPDDLRGLVCERESRRRRKGNRPVRKISRRHPPVQLPAEPPFPETGQDPGKATGIRRDKGDLYPRRIPSPDLQAIQAVQEKVEFPVFRQGLPCHIRTAVRAREEADLADIFQDVAIQPPDQIPDQFQATVDGLQIGRRDAPSLSLQKRLLVREK